MSGPVHPWLLDHWLKLRRARDGGRLPHALLLTGAAGLGKLAFARRLAQSLLCAQPAADGDACGQCHQCQLLAAGNHPDLLEVRPAEEGKGLLIDQIRGLCRELSLKSHAGEFGYQLSAWTQASLQQEELDERTLNTFRILRQSILQVPAPDKKKEVPNKKDHHHHCLVSQG